VGSEIAELASALNKNCCRPISKTPAVPISQTRLKIVSQFFIAHSPCIYQPTAGPPALRSVLSSRFTPAAGDDTPVVQARDLGRTDAQNLAQDLIGMFSQHRRPHHRLARRFAEIQW
jgi:hypothetical protein